MAGAHQIRQHGLHARQVSHLLAHVLELVLGQAAGFLAVGAILERSSAISSRLKPNRWADFTKRTRVTSVSP
jgi:hypothetical protein